jgi:enterochelin esterase-like enzyme
MQREISQMQLNRLISILICVKENMVTDIIRAMAAGGTTTDAIVVGIGYPGDADPQEAWREAFCRRNLDFTLIRDQGSEDYWGGILRRPCPTGDGGVFPQFIKNELIPMIEKEYPVDPSGRTLAGHSAGALFTAFALLDQPGLSSNYIRLSFCGRP